jgi:sortase (surface protein transpeptidase)
VPAALTDAALDLRAGPVAVPLELRLPSLDVTATVSGVGITPTNVMDAPMGPADDPVWQHAFWYRGSAVPGELSTALIAGHINDPLGRPAVFAHIDQLQPGDAIVVHDTRTGLDVRFSVTASATYSLDETADPVVLSEIYGAGPVEGTPPQPSIDGVSHLTLITCTGAFVNGTHDHRLVVYATRVA